MSDSLNTTQLIDLIETQLARSACSKSSTLSFVKGFILGQLSVIIVMILVLRYLFTEDVKRVKKVIEYSIR
jgi:maintenance of morphology protein 1